MFTLFFLPARAFAAAASSSKVPENPKESKRIQESMDAPLQFEELVRCPKTRARVGRLRLKATGPFGKDTEVPTPVFMPVGTAAAMKGVMPSELERTGCRLMLANTYHLGCQPGADVVEEIGGGVHGFMKWPNALLTDSGGFQMVSLSKLMVITEEGVSFQSPYAEEGDIFLSPERCMEIQHKLGANIMMQLDDVVSSTANDQDRYLEAVHRSIRWYDRCRKAHESSGRHRLQNLYPIIQGGLSADLRAISVRELVARDPPGIAIGGLSGGEEKLAFIEMVAASTENLPPGKPRYLMGVGYATDMLLCVALGCDQFDCVFPTRTARFGSALVGLGRQISLLKAEYLTDLGPVDQGCDCSTCTSTTRSYLSHLFRAKNPVACQLLTTHNLRFQMRFMEAIRAAISGGSFVEFMREVLVDNFGSEKSGDWPDWVRRALEILGLEEEFGGK